MQFWVSFDDEQSITATYEALKEQEIVHYPLAQIHRYPPENFIYTCADDT